MSLIMLIEFWIKITVPTIILSTALGKSVDPESAAALYQGFTRPILNDPLKWFHSKSELFLSLFDRVYSGSTTFLYDSLWYAILFCYPAFLLSRIVLAFFAMPTPDTEMMLITILVITSWVVILREILIRMARFSVQLSNGFIKHSVWNQPREVVNILLIAMLLMFIGISTSNLIIHTIGSTFKHIFALSLGASLALPVALSVALIPTKSLIVSPLRAFASSIIFLLIIGWNVPSASFSFFADLDWDTYAGIPLWEIPDFLLSIKRAPVLGSIAFIAYNLFADTISLIETRFLLKLSIGARIGKLVGLLILDLFLSATIYLLLPLIAGQDLQVLRSAIFFSGDKPWLGILFWSTFATSLVFYLFIAANIVIVLVAPLLRLVKGWDSFFNFAKRPLLAIGISMSLALLVIVLLVFLVSRFIFFLG